MSDRIYKTAEPLTESEIIDMVRAAENETFGDEIRMAIKCARIGYVVTYEIDDSEH